jgi:hypothetical protein
LIWVNLRRFFLIAPRRVHLGEARLACCPRHAVNADDRLTEWRDYSRRWEAAGVIVAVR